MYESQRHLFVSVVYVSMRVKKKKQEYFYLVLTAWYSYNVRDKSHVTLIKLVAIYLFIY